MSLIKCPECDHNVSSKAPFCPNCGVLIEGNIKRCPVCGGYSLMAATQCAYCHTKFAPQQTRPAQAEPDKPSSQPDVTQLEERQAATTKPAAAAEDNTTTAAPLPATGANSGSATTEDTPTSIDPRAHQKNSGGAPWYLLIIAIALIGIGGFFYWENENKEASEERAYELLRDCNDPLNYEDFISRYPTSRHIDDVRKRLEELHHEESTWQTIYQKNDIALFQEFIGSHPSSPYKKVALHKIDSLEWREAEKVGTSAAFDTYIDRHDNGEYIDRAFELRAAALAREEKARRDSTAAEEARKRDSIPATVPDDVVPPL